MLFKADVIPLGASTCYCSRGKKHHKGKWKERMTICKSHFAHKQVWEDLAAEKNQWEPGTLRCER